jgi:hypothetical protein
VSQGAFDRLRDNAEAFALSARHSRMFTDGRGHYFWDEMGEDEQRQLRESLERLVCFVRGRCEVLSCSELADLNPDLRIELTQVFGRDSLESMCLAARDGHVLWTDDATVAAVAQDTFKAKRCLWTQHLLRAADVRGLPGPVPLLEASAKLMAYGYANTLFEPATLYWAARMAGWSYHRWPFYQAMRYFRAESIDPRRRQEMAAAFLALVFRWEQSEFARHAILRATLTSFADHHLVRSLGPFINVAFGQDAAGAMQMRHLVAAWLRSSSRFLR